MFTSPSVDFWLKVLSYAQQKRGVEEYAKIDSFDLSRFINGLGQRKDITEDEFLQLTSKKLLPCIPPLYARFLLQIQLDLAKRREENNEMQANASGTKGKDNDCANVASESAATSYREGEGKDTGAADMKGNENADERLVDDDDEDDSEYFLETEETNEESEHTLYYDEYDPQSEGEREFQVAFHPDEDACARTNFQQRCVVSIARHWEVLNYHVIEDNWKAGIPPLVEPQWQFSDSYIDDWPAEILRALYVATVTEAWATIQNLRKEKLDLEKQLSQQQDGASQNSRNVY